MGKDYRNIRFGKLLVKNQLRAAYITKKGIKKTASFFQCACDCGKTKLIFRSNVLNGQVSCGCDRYKKITKHGLRRHYLYSAWAGIKQRCYNQKSQAYAYYGKRGIKFFNKWKNSFENFYSYIINEIGNRPTSRHSLDRKNTFKGYIPGNLRWSDAKQQANNTRRNRFFNHNGKKQTLTQIARYDEKLRKQLWSRVVESKWSIEKALNTPIRKFKLNSKSVKHMRNLYATGDFSKSDIARKFKVSTSTAGAVLNEKSWKLIKT